MAAGSAQKSLHQKVLIAVTPGDPAGIGPEVVRKALADPLLRDPERFRLVGDFTPVEGGPTARSAGRALAAMEEAAALARRGEVAGVVTGPVCKHRLREIGFAFPGQTEFFADRWGAENFAMLLTGGAITVALVTAHIPLAQVAVSLRADEIVRVGRLLAGYCRDRGRARPRIAVAGLNPHAGEEGMLGSEERTVISPALATLAQDGSAFFEGPVPPDTLFHRLAQGEWDAALCMYHDQGLIPLKLHAFDLGVNVTLGLPHIRTSPDHGTAFDLAGRGLARHGSMLAALNLAGELVAGRTARAAI